MTDSNLSEVRRDRNQATFQMIYHQKPISKVLYDISTFFNLNALILDLEDRKISYNFSNCNLQECLEELHSTGRIRMQYGTDFAIFSRSESAVPLLGDKISKVNEKFLLKKQPRFDMSLYRADLHLVLEKIIDKGGLPLALSNQLTNRISLHLRAVIPFEALFYIMRYYRLTFIDHKQVKTIVPQLKTVR